MKPYQPHPKIRPGQRKPYRKATRKQVDRRVGYIARLLRAGRTKTQIHRAVREKIQIEWRQCDRYMASARARIWTKETPPGQGVKSRQI
jgi:hypothetical protein